MVGVRPEDRHQRGGQVEIEASQRMRDADLGTDVTTKNNAVVLLDKIDKADPDAPNNLLSPST